MHTLKIENLKVSVDDKIILDDFNLEINSGEVHVIMGPNGTGKSTLTKVIMGDSNYKVLSGNIYYDDILLNDLTTDKRAKLGIFLGMQSPVEIDGVTNADLLKSAIFDENFKLLNFVKELNGTYDKLNLNKESKSSNKLS